MSIVLEFGLKAQTEAKNAYDRGYGNAKFVQATAGIEADLLLRLASTLCLWVKPMNLTPLDLHDVFVTLQAFGLDAIVVGGQAVNLWAYQYQQKVIEQISVKRQQYLSVMNLIEARS